MNIVIVNHYAGSPTLGMEFRPFYLAKEWKKKGHNVIIIGSSFSHLRSRQPDVNRSIQKDIIDGIDYLWLKVNKYSGNGFGRIVNMLLFIYRLFVLDKNILKDFAPDLIIASSTYPLDNFPVYCLSRKYNALFCYEVHDLWPLSPMELGGYSKHNPFIIALQWAEDFAYRKANIVVSLLPKTLDHMISRGLDATKFIYIPNGIAVDEWSMEPTIPTEHTECLNNLRSQNKYIIGYIGGHSISNALSTLMEAASVAQKEVPNLAFVLTGDGIEKNKLIEKANNQSLRNVFFLPTVPKKCVPRLLSLMDILFLGWHNNPLYRFGISPNKLIDYMMAGKPVVHAVNAGNDMVQDVNCGISVSPDNPKEIVRALKEITEKSEEERKEMGNRGKNYIVKNNNYEVLAQKFITFAKTKTP